MKKLLLMAIVLTPCLAASTTFQAAERVAKFQFQENGPRCYDQDGNLGYCYWRFYENFIGMQHPGLRGAQADAKIEEVVNNGSFFVYTSAEVEEKLAKQRNDLTAKYDATNANLTEMLRSLSASHDALMKRVEELEQQKTAQSMK